LVGQELHNLFEAELLACLRHHEHACAFAMQALLLGSGIRHKKHWSVIALFDPAQTLAAKTVLM
jgi:uncharacterized protein (UPF0332 family)